MSLPTVRRLTLPIGVAVVVLTSLLVTARPAKSETGLEHVVGAITSTVAAQLPANPKIWVPYTAPVTPDRCQDGSSSCIDTTIGIMTSRANALAPTCSHNAVFSVLYLRVTERYREVAATPGYFSTPSNVNHEDAIFADLYFNAYDNWQSGNAQAVPPAWRLAFAAAQARQLQGVGDALLGMIAHILRDLPFALWRISLGERSDHLAINPMLRSVYEQVVGELSRRFDPTIITANLVPGTEGTLVVDALAQWRDQAWNDAVDLVNAPDQQQWNAVAQRVERNAWITALGVYLATKYPLQITTVVRDAYCATHWNT